jgi:hypothetical protein
MTRHLLTLVLLAAAAAATAADAPKSPEARIAELEARIAKLEAAQQPPELGAQMLELQIRHARLWFAGAAKNWTLAAFSLHELDEALEGVVAGNPEHPAMQPARLADVLPAMMDPGIKAVQAALDRKDAKAFAIAYDQLTNGCNACHAAGGFDFNRFGRPKTPLLDNQLYEPAKP